MTTWTAETRAAAIAKQAAWIADSPVPMAVVDYGLSWRRHGSTARYGTRDLRHVALYGLDVVALNPAASPG